jgi:SAM-dependent methyltransferase
MTDPTDGDGSGFEEARARFELVEAGDVHAWLSDLLPSPPALVLDVGSGTGRDAAWLADAGLEVVAAEPNLGMLDLARVLHPSPSIRWLADALPGLDKVFRLGLSFDLILLSAVWMFVPPADRPRAFRKLVTLLKPGGRIAITVRDGPLERGMHAVSKGEIEALARAHGALVERVVVDDDKLGRQGIGWTDIAIRLPDDGTGALPLLRHIILNDRKTATYKLALLRVLCRIADGASGLAREADEDHVAVPLGLVGLYWLRLFKPLLSARLPQTRGNVGEAGLGFVREGFRALGAVSHLDLRVGMGFAAERGAALHAALGDACATIATMPAHYTTYADGSPVLPVLRAARRPALSAIRLDAEYLWRFGELRVPTHLWRAIQRFDVWIEPALIAEWTRLMADYAERQGRRLEDAQVAEAMRWSDPARDVALARAQALRLMEARPLHCVWSGRALSADRLDMDHCFPWAAWPCEDLWNLLPADREVNQRQKRERLPGVGVLRASQERIEDWWASGYLTAPNPTLPERFVTEARASLPMFEGAGASLADVFAAGGIQQIRLRQDQQAPVWEP